MHLRHFSSYTTLIAHGANVGSLHGEVPKDQKTEISYLNYAWTVLLPLYGNSVSYVYLDESLRWRNWNWSFLPYFLFKRVYIIQNRRQILNFSYNLLTYPFLNEVGFNGWNQPFNIIFIVMKSVDNDTFSFACVEELRCRLSIDALTFQFKRGTTFMGRLWRRSSESEQHEDSKPNSGFALSSPHSNFRKLPTFWILQSLYLCCPITWMEILASCSNPCPRFYP